MIKAIATIIAEILWPKLEPMIREKLDEIVVEVRVQMVQARADLMADWDETTDQFVERIVPDVNSLADQIVSKLPNLGLGGLFGGR